MSLIDQYSIGGLDAWGDYEQEFLETLFIPIQQFIDIEERDRCFLCGRRGAGKSAIAVMLHKSDKWEITKIHPGEHSQYGAYIELVEDLIYKRYSGLDLDIKKVQNLLWRYVLRIITLQAIAENPKVFPGQASELLKISNFLKRHSQLTKPIGQILLDFFESSIAQFERRGSKGPLALYSILRKASNSTKLNQALDVVPQLLSNKSLLLVLDSLESYKIYGEGMRDGLRGIISALNEMLTDPLLRKVGVRFFIPAEIYDDVSAEMPAKIMGRSVFVRWKTGDLLKMVSKRYLRMLGRTKIIGPTEVNGYCKLIDSSISGKELRRELWYKKGFMPSTISDRYGFDEDSFAYILRHTQRKPREMIILMNSIVRKAFEKGELPKLSSKSIIDGLHDKIVLQTLVSDALSPFEGYLDNVVEMAKTLFCNRSRIMDGKNLRKFASGFYQLSPVIDIREDDFVNILLKTGMIGVPQVRGEVLKISKGIIPAKFEYLMQGRIPLRDDLMYCVHPAFADLLSLAIDGNEGAIYPVPEDDNWLEEELGLF